jgi:hypothetical protein
MEKAPVDRLDYDVDYGRWLTDSDTIGSASATVVDATVGFVVDQVEWTDQVVRVWVSGGVDGEESEIRVYATTLSGRTKEARFEMRVRDC